MEVDLYDLLISELAGGVWSASRPGRCIPEEGPFHTHGTEGGMGPRSEMEGVESREVSVPVCGRDRVIGSCSVAIVPTESK